ncbi:MAG: hypothetical protein TH68_04110 [Candidatus Synechococcus spongiarum 142]|uniref:AAA+ ATPase domain-containing protein n=1 Tax=Candidatus Synechococcus spongiarum 142 TaxID=1608213 RepID=A0A6N3XBJ1_9SYNE|nr:MAG: hypothetical protein TH68_04110 [Candidatus Synechococcus spongiarum 142]
MGGELPLPSLSISGFRGFENLSIPQLGRVTLLTGLNGVGKTTVLEAIRIYAATTYGTPEPLAALLAERLRQQDEWRDDLDEDGNKVLIADYSTLFHGRLLTPGQSISIGPENDENNVKLEVYQEGTLTKEEEEKLTLSLPRIEDIDVPPLLVTFKNRTKYFLPWTSSRTSSQAYIRLRHRRSSRMVNDNSKESPEKLNCVYIAPNLPSNEDLVEFIDKVTLTEEDYRPKEALELILGYKIYGIAVIGRNERLRPRVMVKLSKQEPRVPLKSLGDGVTRFFGIAAALVKSRNGILLIDEVENGIHYSVHEKLWTMILKAAYKYNIQVVATTHSWDTITGFPRAMQNQKIENSNSTLVRIEGQGENAQAVEYSEEEIKTASQHNIEVR